MALPRAHPAQCIATPSFASVRALLTQATWQAITHSPEVRAFRDRVMRNDPQRKKKATVAAMHYLARTMVAMLRDGAVWAPKAQ
ncbi:hypothetical protein HQ560_20830 [bacterium]|nr:hypothetical protein [bacterium]